MQKRDINPKKTEKKKRGESMDIERYTEEKIRQEAEPDRGTEGKRMHDTPKGERESERERRRDIETAETSGDIGETLTPEERKRKAREKANKNLITTAQMTEDQRREFARIGGRASAAARRRKKDVREVFDALLSAPPTPEMLKKAENLGFSKETVSTVYDVLGAALVEKALSGDGYAFQLIRDSAGDKPTDKTEVTASVMTEKDLELLRNVEKRLKMSAEDEQK